MLVLCFQLFYMGYLLVGIIQSIDFHNLCYSIQRKVSSLRLAHPQIERIQPPCNCIWGIACFLCVVMLGRNLHHELLSFSRALNALSRFCTHTGQALLLGDRSCDMLVKGLCCSYPLVDIACYYILCKRTFATFCSNKRTKR